MTAHDILAIIETHRGRSRGLFASISRITVGESVVYERGPR